MYDKDYYDELCERADYYGIESLTETEQAYILGYQSERLKDYDN